MVRVNPCLKGLSQMIDEKIFKNRITELAERAYVSSRYTYTDFLGLYELDILSRMKREVVYAGLSLFGGADDCERVVARFGNAAVDEPFPIACVKAEPLQQKFADRLTHRDALGAILNLGIERDTIGDIYISENIIYFFCLKNVLPVILNDLKTVKRTTIRCSEIECLPEGVGTAIGEEMIQISSERADVIVAAAYRFSREESLSLFREKKVFIDGRICENNSETLTPGCVVSVRGHGRFRYLGYNSLSRKGKLNAHIARWL